ncbi:MAG: metal ABC transporter permease [Candidatus Dependentiae bacterium]|nr:metal ABC transporter permease [Candidatus Dependentiae bacterium]
MIIFDQTLLIILLGTGLLGISAGIVGCFILLQEKSLFGDTIAHATLPGICGIFLLTESKLPCIIMIGGIFSATIGSIAINYITAHSSLKKDTALGIVLATSFGLGTLLLSKIQTSPNANQAGITKYLLGNASTMLNSDLYFITGATIIIFLSLKLFWNEYKIFLFNKDYGESIGVPTKWISFLLSIITIITIVVGLQTVGVILISALLIAPAGAARQWTNSLSTMVFLSSCFGLFSTTIGTLLSSSIPHLPTGPTIVIIACSITFISMLFSQNGIITTIIKQKIQTKKINALKMLSHFMLFNESKTDPFHAHDLAALKALGKKGTSSTLTYLQSHGLIEPTQKNFWRLTPNGLETLKNELIIPKQKL